jgi:mono/diheme cytochrome c family protein
LAVIRQLGAVAGLMIVFAVLGVGCGGTPSGPAALKTGRGIYADQCSVCHGNRGQGGVGPSLSEVRETWPDCVDHQEWIALGSEGWKTEHGPTYGADDSPITEVMPGQAGSLTPGEIALVAAFERVEYGGGDAATELAACDVPDE